MVANDAPILAGTLLGDRVATPIDLGRTFGGRRPSFGPGKRFRGLAASCAAIALAASVARRRLGLPAYAQAFGLDQIAEALLPLLVLRRRQGPRSADIAATVALGEVVLARLFHRLGLRDRPYRGVVRRSPRWLAFPPATSG